MLKLYIVSQIKLIRWVHLCTGWVRNWTLYDQLNCQDQTQGDYVEFHLSLRDLRRL